MISLLDELKDELIKYLSLRNDSYKNTIVKKMYEALPKGQYPRITIEEIINTSVLGRETAQGERTTSLTYQFNCYSRDTEEYNYVDSVRFMAQLIDDFIKNSEYFCRMTRIMTSGAQPYTIDDTVMTYNIRYSCVYDEETNLIYTN